MRGRGDRPEAGPFGRVDVQDQVGGPVLVPDQGQRRVVLDGPLVGEPHQRAPVVDQRIGDHPAGRVGPHLGGLDPLRRVLGQVLLHERFLAGPDPHHRQRPVPQHRDDPVPHRVQVVDQVLLGRVCPVEQRLIQMGQRDAIPFVAHELSLAQPRFTRLTQAEDVAGWTRMRSCPHDLYAGSQRPASARSEAATRAVRRR